MNFTIASSADCHEIRLCESPRIIGDFAETSLGSPLDWLQREAAGDAVCNSRIARLRSSRSDARC